MFGKDGTDGTDGLDGALVGPGWDGRLLAPAGTGAPEWERHSWPAGYREQGTNGTDGLDGALAGRGWDGRTNVSGCRNGSATVSAGTGAPPLALGGRRAMRSGSRHQFRRCCKDAEYLCRRSKAIQIERTQIRTSIVVQDSIKRTYDTIIIWLHTTINRTYNAIVPK